MPEGGLGQLAVSIVGDVQRLITALKDGRAAVRQFAEDATRNLASVESSLKKVGLATVGAGKGGGGRGKSKSSEIRENERILELEAKILKIKGQSVEAQEKLQQRALSIATRLKRGQEELAKTSEVFATKISSIGEKGLQQALGKRVSIEKQAFNNRMQALREQADTLRSQKKLVEAAEVEGQMRVAKAERRGFTPQQMTTVHTRNTEAIRKAREEQNKLTSSTEETGQAINRLTGMIQRMVGAFIIYKIIDGFQAMIRAGLEFNAIMEGTQAGIAGLLISVKNYVDVTTGQAVDTTRAYGAAILEAGQSMKLLQQINLETAATLPEILIQYQQLIATMGGIEGATPKALTALTKRFSILGQMFMIPQYQMMEEIRSATTGAMKPQLTRVLPFFIGQFAKKGLTQDPEEVNAIIRRWKKSGTLMKEMTNLLSPMDAIAKKLQGTWSVAISNLKDLVSMLLGDGFKPLFEYVRDNVNVVTEALKSPERKEEMLAFLGSFNKTLVDMAENTKIFISALALVLNLLNKIGGIRFLGWVTQILAIALAIKGIVVLLHLLKNVLVNTGKEVTGFFAKFNKPIWAAVIVAALEIYQHWDLIVEKLKEAHNWWLKILGLKSGKEQPELSVPGKISQSFEATRLRNAQKVLDLEKERDKLLEKATSDKVRQKINEEYEAKITKAKEAQLKFDEGSYKNELATLETEKKITDEYYKQEIAKVGTKIKKTKPGTVESLGVPGATAVEVSPLENLQRERSRLEKIRKQAAAEFDAKIKAAKEGESIVGIVGTFNKLAGADPEEAKKNAQLLREAAQMRREALGIERRLKIATESVNDALKERIVSLDEERKTKIDEIKLEEGSEKAKSAKIAALNLLYNNKIKKERTDTEYELRKLAQDEIDKQIEKQQQLNDEIADRYSRERELIGEQIQLQIDLSRLGPEARIEWLDQEIQRMEQAKLQDPEHSGRNEAETKLNSLLKERNDIITDFANTDKERNDITMQQLDEEADKENALKELSLDRARYEIEQGTRTRKELSILLDQEIQKHKDALLVDKDNVAQHQQAIFSLEQERASLSVNIWRDVTQAIGDSFLSAIDDVKSFGDFFISFFRDLAKQIRNIFLKEIATNIVESIREAMGETKEGEKKGLLNLIGDALRGNESKTSFAETLKTSGGKVWDWLGGIFGGGGQGQPQQGPSQPGTTGPGPIPPGAKMPTGTTGGGSGLGLPGGIAGAASLLGQFIPGRAGQIISGAGSGAMVGGMIGSKIGMIGGPLGMAIGAGAGALLSGIFGGSKKEKDPVRASIRQWWSSTAGPALKELKAAGFGRGIFESVTPGTGSAAVKALGWSKGIPQAALESMKNALESLKDTLADALEKGFKSVNTHRGFQIFLKNVRRGIAEFVQQGLIDGILKGKALTQLFAPIYEAVSTAVIQAMQFSRTEGKKGKAFDPQAFGQEVMSAWATIESLLPSLEPIIAMSAEVSQLIMKGIGQKGGGIGGLPPGFFAEIKNANTGHVGGFITRGGLLNVKAGEEIYNQDQSSQRINKTPTLEQNNVFHVTGDQMAEVRRALYGANWDLERRLKRAYLT